MTAIRSIKDKDNMIFYPRTHAQAVDGLEDYVGSQIPVTSINGKTGAVQLTASDVGAETPQEIDDKLTAKQDLFLTSPSGNKFTLAVADDGTLSTLPHTGG
ncbi:hypothetical protein [Sporolactobacillus sp. KGMB 08714]|uniref:hypothetical protein n=1 Tax=Sporolactobacillus sp. KGMB 08714 TaxID=3064704 RepID=UPI002FBD6EEF